MSLRFFYSKFAVVVTFFTLPYFLLIASLSMAQQPGDVGTSSSNVVWYKPYYYLASDGELVSTIQDFSGNANHAVSINSSSLSFDGVNDHATSNKVDASVANNFTMELWVMPNATITIPSQDDEGHTAGMSGQRYAIYPHHGEDGNGWGSGHAGAGISVGTNGVCVFEHGHLYMAPILVYPVTISSTTWTHIAVVYTSNRPTVYVTPEGGSTTSYQGLQSLKTVHPSTQFGGGGYGYYSGKLDEFRIWSESRSTTPLSTYRHMQVNPLSTNLVAYWKMDEGTGTTAYNATNSNNATLNNGPTWSSPGSSADSKSIFYVSAQTINTNPVLYLNGWDSRLELPSNTAINSGGPYEGKTIFITFKTNYTVSSRQVLYEEGDQNKGLNIYLYNGKIYCHAWNATDDDGSGPHIPWSGVYVSTPVSIGTSYFVSFVYDSNRSLVEGFLNGTPFQTQTYAHSAGKLYSHDAGTIGANKAGTRYHDSFGASGSNYIGENFVGHLGEFIMYTTALNSAERKTIENYLSSKFTITNSYSDYYSYESTHPELITGIGKDDADNIRSSAKSDFLAINSNSLTNYDFAFVGHDNASTSSYYEGWKLSSDNAPKNVKRMYRTWRLDLTGTISTLNFSIPQSSLATLESYQVPVLILKNGSNDFTTGSRVIGLTAEGSNYTVSDVPVQDGDYISFGVLHINDTQLSNDIAAFGTADHNYDDRSLTSSILEIGNPSSPVAGDYLIAAHDGASISITNNLAAPANMQRMERVWRISRYEYPGNLDFMVKATDLSFPSGSNYNSYVVLISATDDFSDINSPNISKHRMVKMGNRYAAHNIPIQYDGAYVTIAATEYELNQDIVHKVEFKESFSEISGVTSKNLFVKRDEGPVPASSCIERLKKAYLKVNVNTGKEHIFGSSTFTEKVRIQVDAYKNFAGTGTPFTSSFLNLPVTDIVINHDTPEKLQYFDITWAYGQGVVLYKVTVSFPDAVNNPAVRSAVVVNAYIEEDKTMEITSVLYSPIETKVLERDGTPTKVVKFSWDTDHCDATSYQFQLLKLYNTENPAHTDEHNITAEIDWSRALTLETTEKEVTLTLAEGTGYYAWRVRPVGNYYPGGVADSRNWGKWSTNNVVVPSPVTLTSSSTPEQDYANTLFYYEQFDRDKNFIFSRTFSEDNRVHEGMTYANGLLQTRQTQGHAFSNKDEDTENHNGEILINQIVYDYSGRAALNSMTAPDINSSNNNYLGYREGALLDGNGTLYSAKNFDAYDPTSIADPTKTNYNNPNAIGGGLINQYYSNLNTMDANVPSSDGYPFSRTLFDNDGLNRQKEISGVGPTHKIGQQTVRMEYGSVSDDELIRIFGDEAPKASTVYKTVTTDQNNISSIAYIDMSGKTIATCLSRNNKPTTQGGATQSLEALPSELEEETEFTIMEAIDNNVKTEKGVFATKALNLTETTDLELNFELTQALINSSCVDGYCAKCGYIITVKIYNLEDPCQDITLTEEIAPGSFVEEPCSTEVATLTQTVEDLAPGKYVIEKRIEINPDAGKVYAEAVAEKIAGDLQSIVDVINNPTNLGNSDPLTGLTNLNSYLTSLQTSPPTGLKLEIYNEQGVIRYSNLDNNPANNTPVILGEGDQVAFFTSCCSVKIPIVFPQQPVCPNNNLGQYMIDAFFEKVDPSETNTFSYYTGYSEADFISLINNMLADSNTEWNYNCDHLWPCWNSVIQSYGKTANASSPTYDGTQPDWVDDITMNPTTRNIMNEFLECAGKHYQGYSSDGQWVKPRAYKYFVYKDNSTARTTGESYCEQMLCDPSQSTYNICSSPVCEIEYVAATGHSSEVIWLGIDHDNNNGTAAIKITDQSGVAINDNEKNYARLYQCLQSQKTDAVGVNNLPTTAELEADLLEQKDKMEDECKAACEGKREEFMTKLKVLLDPENDGVYSYNNTEVFLPQICCTADRLVDYCRSQCNLTLLKKDCSPAGFGSEDKILGLGTAAEVEIIQSVLYGSFDLLTTNPGGTCSVTGYTRADVCNSPAGIFHLNGNVNDDRPSGINGSINGTVLPNSGCRIAGTSGSQSYSFNPVFGASNISFGNNDRGVTTAITVMGWVKSSASTDMAIASKYNSGTNRGYTLYIQNGKAFFKGVDLGGTTRTVEATYTTVNDNAWHFITGVCDNNKWQIWVDGKLENEMIISGTGVDLQNAGNLYVGYTTHGNMPFNGLIDEVYIYSCALTPAQIKDMYEDSKFADYIYENYNSSTCPATMNTPPNLLWDKLQGASGIDEVYNWIDLKDGTYIGVGVLNTYAVGSVPDLYAFRVTNSGMILWKKTYGGSSGESYLNATLSYDGKSLLILGTTKSTNISGISNPSGLTINYSVKVSIVDGSIEYQKTYANASLLLNAVSISGNNFVLAGSSSNGNAYISKISSTGSVVWEGTPGGNHSLDAFIKVHESKSGDLYFTGITKSSDIDGGSPSNFQAYYILKTNNTGTVQWQKAISGNNWAYHNNSHFINDKIYIVGTTTSTDIPQASNNGGIYMVEVDSDGAILNQKVFGNMGDDVTTSIISKSGDLIIYGATYSTSFLGHPVSGASDLYILRVSLSGALINAALYGGNALEYDEGGICETNDGGFAISAITTSTDIPNNDIHQDQDLYVVKVGNDLSKEWERAYGGDANEEPRIELRMEKTPLIINTGDGLLVGVSTNSTNSSNSDVSQANLGNSDIWVLKLGYSCNNPLNICLKWLPPQTTSIDPEEVDEEYNKDYNTRVVDQIKATIENQVLDCKTRNEARLVEEYKNTCKGNDLQESCTINYNLSYHHYTLYYYDRAGNLVRTIPPRAVEPLICNPDPENQQHKDFKDRKLRPQHIFELATTYKYNMLKQLVEQTSPDGGTVKFIYNRIGQLRFSQNGNQLSATPQKFSYVKYDYLGRAIESGEAELPSDAVTFADLGTITQSGNPQKLKYLDEGVDYPALGENSFPLEDKQQETYTVYSENSGLVDYLGTEQRHLRNRVSYVYSKSLDGETSVTYYSYDPHGNVDWLVQDIPGMSKNYIGYEYDLISNKVTKVKFNEKRPGQFFHKYQYDTDNRITAVFTSKDGLLWDKDGSYSFYKHGPMKRVELGEDRLQGLDHVYTIHGWLKAINSPTLTPGDDPGGDGGTPAVPTDEYGMVLGYFNGDFTRSGVFNSVTGNANTKDLTNTARPLYNGNITSWVTRIAEEARDGNLGSDPYKYTTGNLYTYDDLNRIVQSDYQEMAINTVPEPDEYSFVPQTEYQTQYTYDGSGNIKTMLRKGAAGNEAMDDLTYNYYENKNQLMYVEDAVASSYNTDIDNQTVDANTELNGIQNYEYDAIGNLIIDKQEKVAITWNLQNKIHEVNRIDGSTKDKIRFTYDASGNRIRKEVIHSPYNSPELVETTFYVRDGQGNIVAVYKRKNEPVSGQPDYYTATYTQIEVPIYGSNRLGNYTPDPSEATVATKVFHKDDIDKVSFDMDLNTRNPEANAWEVGTMTTDVLTDASSGSHTVYQINKHRVNYESSIPAMIYQGTSVSFLGSGLTENIASTDIGINSRFSALTAEKYWDKNNVCLVMDVNNLVMPGSAGIKSNPKAQSVFVKKPGNNNQHYLITIGGDRKIYYHTIDQGLQGNTKLVGMTPQAAGDVSSVNNLLDKDWENPGPGFTRYYGTSLAVVELQDPASTANTKKALVYATRHNSATGTVEIVLFEIAEGGEMMQTPEVVRTLTDVDTYSQSEMTISPDGKKLIFFNHKQKQGWFNQQKTEVRIFALDNNYRILDNVLADYAPIDISGGTLPGQSAEFTKDNRYLYYTREVLVDLPAFSNSNKGMYRYDLKNEISENVGDEVAGDLRRGKDGRIYHAREGEILMNSYLTDQYGTHSTTMVQVDVTYPATGAISPQNHKYYYNETTAAIGFVARALDKKHYEISDHLGNVTVVIGDSRDENAVVVENYSNYYPFGMLMPLKYDHSGEGYRYGYNGKEQDEEWNGDGNMYDYGFRIYDPRIAKFLSVDPLTKDYPELTPYQFASNTPIWAIDLDGLEAKVYFDTKGVGHTFISVTDDKGVLHIYTYGQYGQGTTDGKSKAYGEGALVHLVGKDAEAYLTRGFNKTSDYKLSVYELGKTEVDRDKIMDHYNKILNDPNAVPAEKVNDVSFVKDDPNSRAVKYSKYGGIPSRWQDNCVTVADEGLEAGGSNILLMHTIPDLAQNDAEIFSWFESDITEVTEEVRKEYVTK